MATVALIFGGRSVEHEVSVASARTVGKALLAAGHQVVPVAIAMDGGWASAEDSRAVLDGEREHLVTANSQLDRFAGLVELLGKEADVAFPIVHGTWGEDGTLQGLLEMLDLPYVGCGVAASAVAMDKGLAKDVLVAAGLSVVDGEVVTRSELAANSSTTAARLARLGEPIFVKPCIGGSSVGVTKTDQERVLQALDHALKFDDRAIVERAIEGRELECAVLGYRSFEASAIGEIVPGGEFYDYFDKYVDDAARLDAPATLDENVARKIRELAIAAFGAIGGCGMARVDFLLDTSEQTAGEIYLNEINSLPGFTAISMYPRLWEITGLPIPALVDRLIEIAVQRFRDRQELDSGIKTFIESLEEGRRERNLPAGD